MACGYIYLSEKKVSQYMGVSTSFKGVFILPASPGRADREEILLAAWADQPPVEPASDSHKALDPTAKTSIRTRTACNVGACRRDFFTSSRGVNVRRIEKIDAQFQGMLD